MMPLLKDLVDLQVPSEVQLSPDARHVVYSTSSRGTEVQNGSTQISTLWLAHTGEVQSARPVTTGKAHDRSPRWLSDGKSIAFISDRAKVGESCAIFTASIIDNGEPAAITPTNHQSSITAYEVSPDGEWIAFVSADEQGPDEKARKLEKDDAVLWGEEDAYARLRLLHTTTKQLTTLTSKNVHIQYLAWSPDSKTIAFTSVVAPDAERVFLHGTTVSTIDITSQHVRELCTFPCGIYSFTWVGNDLLFTGSAAGRYGNDSSSVYRIDLTLDSTTAPNYIKIGDHGTTVCAETLRRAGADAVVSSLQRTSSHIGMVEGRTIFSSTTQILAWDAAFTTDSDEMIVAAVLSDTDHPPEVFTTTASGGALVRLSAHGTQLAETYGPFGSTQVLTCSSDDGTVQLDALFIKPAKRRHKGRETDPWPTVVSIHGGPYYRHAPAFEPDHYSLYMWTPMLLSRGFAVLMPNYRGSSGKGAAFAALGRGYAGTYDYDDVITLTNQAVEHGLADPAHLAVTGWSQGGHLSYLCAVRNGTHKHPWRFSAAIPGAGVTDWDTLLQTSDAPCLQAEIVPGAEPWLTRTYVSDTRNRHASAIWQFRTAVEDGVQLPKMLLLHGEDDVRTPVEQAKAFWRACRSAGVECRLVIYPREGHVFRERRHVVDLTERLVGFVEEHIGGS